MFAHKKLPPPPRTGKGTSAQVKLKAVSHERGTYVVVCAVALGYSGTSLIRNRPPLGPNSRTMPRAL